MCSGVQTQVSTAGLREEGKSGHMPKVVELTSKSIRAKPMSGAREKAGDTAEIVIFPGVRYERVLGEDLPDPVQSWSLIYDPGAST